MICLSRDFNHLSAFSITNLSKQITFTPFVLFSPTCFFLSTVLTILFTCKTFALCVYIYISVWVLVYVCESSFSSRSQSFRTNYFSKVNVKLNIWWIFLSAALSVPSAVTDPDDEDEDEFDDSEESAEADDDGRIYKNPRNSPSSDCPRDEEQATLLGQKCLRKCSSHEDCKSKKKKCLCDGACGMSCIKPGAHWNSNT